MATLLDGYTHHHVTEREIAHQSPCGFDDASWEDCTFCVAVEWLRAIGHTSIPATHAEAEALRCASGRAPTGGTNQDDVRRAALARYGIALPAALEGFDALWSALAPGHVASVQGSMGAFAAGSHFRRWDPAFAGGHDALAARLDALDRVWWCDPLAPEGLGYEGEWMAKADLERFVGGLAGAKALVGRIVPDPAPAAHRFVISAGVRTLYLAKLTADHPARIAGWTPVAWSGKASSAPCDPALYLRGTSSGGATVARITSGAVALRGHYARVGHQWGTSVTP